MIRPLAFSIGLVGLLLPSPVPQSPPPIARRTGTFQDRRLDESSGVIVSRKYPGLLWTMNDSGGEPALFLTDTAGAALGVYPVIGARNVDWESLGRGPCGREECLYVGDTGDNGERRPSVVIYRLPEPDPRRAAPRAPPRRVERLSVRYPDRPHDVEALYVEPDGSVVLVTKGRRGGVLMFRVTAAAWAAPGTVTAVRIDSLPMVPSMFSGRLVTDAAISSDGKRVAVRTYREIAFYIRDSAGTLTPEPGTPPCEIGGLEPQGEGIDWWDHDTLVLTSERAMASAGTITLVRCPRR